MKTIIKNAHIISPDIEVEAAAVLVDGKLIASVHFPEEPDPPADRVIDAKGKMLVPGFIDIHIHGRSGYDFCDGSKESVAALAKEVTRDGVTSFLGTTLTVHESRIERSLQAAAQHMAQKPVGAKILGSHLEGPFFNPCCAGAQNPAFLRDLDVEFVKRLHAIFPVKKVSYSIELDGALEFTRELVSMGIMPSCGHSAAGYAQFRKMHFVGLRQLTHFCNVIPPLHHLEIGLVGAGLLHRDVMLELICDKIHICPEMIRLLFEIKGPERIMLITDAMRGAGMPDGEFELGGLPVHVSGGCARLEDGKIAGSTLLYYQGLRNVRDITGLPMKELIKTSSWNQACSLGFAKLGRIATGFSADLVLLDDDFSPTMTIVDGEIAFQSSSG